MLERFKALVDALNNRAALVTGDHRKVFSDRADQVASWVESIEQGWPINTDYACTAATEFEKMLGIA